MLSGIHSCSRRTTETLRKLSNSFKITIARYLTHTSYATNNDTCQWAILGLENCKYSADTYKIILFQFTTAMMVRERKPDKTKICDLLGDISSLWKARSDASKIGFLKSLFERLLMV